MKQTYITTGTTGYQAPVLQEFIIRKEEGFATSPATTLEDIDTDTTDNSF